MRRKISVYERYLHLCVFLVALSMAKSLKIVINISIYARAKNVRSNKRVLHN